MAIIDLNWKKRIREWSAQVHSRALPIEPNLRKIEFFVTISQFPRLYAYILCPQGLHYHLQFSSFTGFPKKSTITSYMPSMYDYEKVSVAGSSKTKKFFTFEQNSVPGKWQAIDKTRCWHTQSKQVCDSVVDWWKPLKEKPLTMCLYM